MHLIIKLQVRQNANELQDFFSDLGKWLKFSYADRALLIRKSTRLSKLSELSYPSCFHSSRYRRGIFGDMTQLCYLAERREDDIRSKDRALLKGDLNPTRSKQLPGV